MSDFLPFENQIEPTGPKVQTMDSRDIAELTGKMHKHVARDIQVMLEGLEIDVTRFGHISTDSYGRPQRCYKLPYRETMILVSGYSVELRARVVDRWLELEASAAPRTPQTFAEALRLAADQAEKIEAQENALAIAAPKVESFEALMRSSDTMSITDAAKHFGKHPKTEVFPYLRDKGYLTEKDMPTQAAIDADYLWLRETLCSDKTVRRQAVVLASQLETWRTRVIPQIEKWIKEP
jgi:phage antirepressor YoqD-like protein